MVLSRFSRVVLAGAIFGVAAISSATSFRFQIPAPVPPVLQDVHRVVCLGDSITEQGENPGGYVWLLRRYLERLYPEQRIETLNAGKSGHKSTDMMARFRRDVLDKHPDLVTISVGVNDVWHGFYDGHPMGDGPRGIRVEEYRDKVDSMVSQAQALGIKVVILSTTVIHEDLENRENAKATRYNEILMAIARAHRCPYVNFQVPFRTLIRDYQRTTGGHENVLTVDGVHMNTLGNQVMAHTILSDIGVPHAAQQRVQEMLERER